MAAGRKTGGKNFVKGQSGNPNGRPALPPELRKKRKLSYADYIDSIQFFATADKAEVEQAVQDESVPFYKHLIAIVLWQAKITGNMTQYFQLIDRLFGKTKESVDVSIKKPTMLIKTDGTQVIFKNTKDDDEQNE